MLKKIIRSHHERIDGSGYPNGLKGEQIDLLSRIIAVADSFDAMDSDRPYRTKIPLENIKKELSAISGKALDADCVQALFRLLEKEELHAEALPKRRP